MDERATRQTWNTVLPLPTQRAKLQIRRAFTPQEYARLAEGFIPVDMEDRWFIFMEDDNVFFHRSWTGICIYEVRLDERHCVTDAWVNRDNQQYYGVSLKEDRRVLLHLIDDLLLGPTT